MCHTNLTAGRLKNPQTPPLPIPIQQSIPHILRSSWHHSSPRSGTFSMLLLTRRFSSVLARSPFLARCPLPPRAVPTTAPASRPPPRRLMSSSSSGWHHSSPPPPPPPPPPSSSSDKDQLFRGLEAALGTTFSSDPLAPPPEPMIIIISGPSGVGKDAVIKRLQEEREEIHFVVTATSRAMRPGEVDGKDYHFVTKEEFLTMIEREELLEYALVYGEYKGIPKQQIRDYMAKGHDIVLRVDIQGAATLREILGESAIFIFLVAESEDALVKRLIHRKTEAPDMLLVRIATAREEVRRMKHFDYVVVNAEGKLEGAVKQVESIIDAEKAKIHKRRLRI